MDKLRFFSPNTATQVRQTDKLRFSSPLILEYKQAKHTNNVSLHPSYLNLRQADGHIVVLDSKTDGQTTFRFTLILGSK